ncbi:chorismate mutase [Niveomyces insectorum RCEF 264]|uniref:Chorismate mutase n=1 Tax=Niveomyces insectorum RCEF 264 TaxID=1081102 RepID=A0A167USK8_9HYPO|nr:chorismate mutase [Niveomyces insectorum RCEF 264]
MDSSIDLSDPQQALDLSRIRYQLIRLEDTITFHLIERVQFPLNKSIYQPGAVSIRGGDSGNASWFPGPLARLFSRSGASSQSFSFMDWYLRQQEALQSRIRRFESPDENAFFPDALQPPILQPLHYPPILHPNDVVVNDRIKRYYVDVLLPAVCDPDLGHGDRGETQENYGSAATCDIAVLQALSRRIHFGKFVAEAKFRAERARYTALIRAEDREGLGTAIVNKAVERAVLQRMRRKVATYGQTLEAESGTGGGAPPGACKINVDAVVALYEEFVIPVTKDVEVEYLMQRLDGDEGDDAAAATTTRKRPATASSTSSSQLLWGLGAGAGALLVAATALRWLPRK